MDGYIQTILRDEGSEKNNTITPQREDGIRVPNPLVQGLTLSHPDGLQVLLPLSVKMWGLDAHKYTHIHTHFVDTDTLTYGAHCGLQHTCLACRHTHTHTHTLEYSRKCGASHGLWGGHTLLTVVLTP